MAALAPEFRGLLLWDPGQVTVVWASVCTSESGQAGLDVLSRLF